MDNNITGIVLAGGKSSRMGKNKALIKFKGKTIIEDIVDKLVPVSKEIIISASDDSYNFLDLQTVRDEIPECGPLGGMYSCMKFAKENAFLVVSCDLPFISNALLEYMISQINNYDAIIPIDSNGRYQPLCACYNKSCLADIQISMQRGEYKIMKAIENLNIKFIPINANSPFYSEKMFYNVNYPSDFEKINEDRITNSSIINKLR
ncbi:MAG: molybdenum cofactor guanylyltransferase [Bacteroidota bacterium]|nr:molybdenum cofactor guanylyltransferase [Bacteroidota bacterium]